MSFLLKRSDPWVYAGWYDSFNNYSAGPVVQPWRHMGDGSSSFDGAGQLLVGANFTTVTGGGPGYEFEPFTPAWGIEFDMIWPVEGAAAQAIRTGILKSWKEIGDAFKQVVEILVGTAPLGSGPVVNVVLSSEWMNPGRTVLLERSLPFDPRDKAGAPINVRVWVDYDKILRIWVDGTYIGAAAIPDGYIFHDGRRAVRFLNASLAELRLQWIYAYDRQSDLPDLGPVPWGNAIFADNFNRSNGAVGNGWTSIGTAQGIVSNSWTKTGGSDGKTAIIRNSGVTTGAQRVVVKIGGSIGLNGTATSGAILRCNSAGTSGLVMDIRSGSVWIRQFNAALNSNDLLYAEWMRINTTFTNGEEIAFSCAGNTAWVERVSDNSLIGITSFGHLPETTHTYFGLRNERTPFNNSHSWDDIKFYTYI